METNYTDESAIWILVALVGILFLFGLLVVIASWLNEFQKELKYLKSEIRRTRGEERKYWIHQKRRLWLSIIPFFRY